MIQLSYLVTSIGLQKLFLKVSLEVPAYFLKFNLTKFNVMMYKLNCRISRNQ